MRHYMSRNTYVNLLRSELEDLGYAVLRSAERRTVADIIAIGNDDILFIKAKEEEFECDKDFDRLLALPSLPRSHKALFLRRKGRNNGWKIIAVNGSSSSREENAIDEERVSELSRKAWLRSLGITLDSAYTD